MPDNAYEDAVKTVIDDHMRTDVLGPHFLRVLREHKPTSDQLVAMIAKEVGKDPALKKAIKQIVSDWNSENKMKWVNAGIGAISTLSLRYLFVSGAVTPHS